MPLNKEIKPNQTKKDGRKQRRKEGRKEIDKSKEKENRIRD